MPPPLQPSGKVSLKSCARVSVDAQPGLARVHVSHLRRVRTDGRPLQEGIMLGELCSLPPASAGRGVRARTEGEAAARFGNAFL